MESHAHSYRRSALASSACNRETISPSGFSRSHESQDVPRHPRLDHAQLKRRTTDMPGVEPDIGGPSLARNRPLMPHLVKRRDSPTLGFAAGDGLADWLSGWLQ